MSWNRNTWEEITCDKCQKTVEPFCAMEVPYGWYTLVGHFDIEGDLVTHLCSADCIKEASMDRGMVGYHAAEREEDWPQNPTLSRFKACIKSLIHFTKKKLNLSER